MTIRQVKADKKMNKIRRLTSRPLKHKLAMAHYGPQALHAAEVLGISSASARHHRHQMATTLGWTPGSCILSVLAVSSADLVADSRWKSLWLWTKLWRDLQVRREHWRSTWADILARQEKRPSTKRWQHAIGPVASLITMLLEQGWDPMQPDKWKAPDGEEYVLDDANFDPKALKLSFVDQCMQTELKRSSTGHLGQGMQDGVYWHQARAHLKG